MEQGTFQSEKDKPVNLQEYLMSIENLNLVQKGLTWWMIEKKDITRFFSHLDGVEKYWRKKLYNWLWGPKKAHSLNT